MKKTISLFSICLLTSFGISAISAQQCQKTITESSQSCSRPETVLVSTPAQQDKDIVETAVSAGKFQTLVAAVKAAGLVETLQGSGPFTVFAPADDAFAKLPKETIEMLLLPESKSKLQSILTYHVVPGRTMAADVVKLDNVKTVQGQTANIKVLDGKVMINDAQIIATDIVCKNGVIHVIDSVIMPPARPDIVDTAVAAGTFTTLVAAVKAADLVETLKSEGPFTVFAPSDEAFSKIPAETIQQLLKPEGKDQLASILTYHVVKGRVPASQVAGMSSATTVNGKAVAVKVNGDRVMIDNATVTATDIECGNGIIHVIDTVIMPK